jgi:hypothetical protein
MENKKEVLITDKKRKMLTELLKKKDELKNTKVIENTYKKFIIPNFSTILNTIIKGFMFIIQTFLKPFLFSSSKRTVIAPYMYVLISMIFFYISIYAFLDLSYKAAIVGIKSPEVILPTIAGVIVTLMGATTLMIKVYNDGKNRNNTEEHTNNEDEEKVQ